ncbi:MAG: hypothetical protein ACREM3_01245 [Candidatus Rokuibacteriota bacterium]
MGVLIAITFLLLLLVLVVGAGVWLFDLGGRREREAEALEEQLVIAVRRGVGDVGVLPVAYLSSSGSTQDVVELHGRVPSAEVREAVLRAVEDQLSRSRPGCRLQDRLAVVEDADRHTAA